MAKHHEVKLRRCSPCINSDWLLTRLRSLKERAEGKRFQLIEKAIKQVKASSQAACLYRMNIDFPSSPGRRPLKQAVLHGFRAGYEEQS